MVVVGSGHEIVGLVCGSGNSDFIILEYGEFVEDCIQPVDVGLGKQSIVLSRIHSRLLFILDPLGRVHQVPVSVGYG